MPNEPKQLDDWLAGLDEVEAKATSGPWGHMHGYGVFGTRDDGGATPISLDRDGSLMTADQAIALAARNALPKLVAMVRYLNHRHGQCTCTKHDPTVLQRILDGGRE